MGWLSKLFGSAEPRAIAWRKSENGNLTSVVQGKRVTIYPDSGGWKFCLADADEEREPFSLSPTRPRTPPNMRRPQ